MGKKLKKRPVSAEPVDPNLEDVGEERAFEIEYDDEMNEVVFVHHYRRKWEDQFDADVEHGYNLDECRAIIGVMLSIMQEIENKTMLEKLEAKSTPEPVEKNPLKDNPTQ